MKSSLLIKLLRFYPPFIGAGISIKEYNPDYSYILVQMKLRFWNKNYLGTHFGGSLYSMTDPFYVLMLSKQLGSEFIVWDKSATIRYLKPAVGTVFARFELSSEQINHIKDQLENNRTVEPKFTVFVTDSKGAVLVKIEKTLHIRRCMD